MMVVRTTSHSQLAKLSTGEIHQTGIEGYSALKLGVGVWDGSTRFPAMIHFIEIETLYLNQERFNARCTRSRPGTAS
jgi:hypothetical protein